jgi:hypothetical protein
MGRNQYYDHDDRDIDDDDHRIEFADPGATVHCAQQRGRTPAISPVQTASGLIG